MVLSHTLWARSTKTYCSFDSKNVTEISERMTLNPDQQNCVLFLEKHLRSVPRRLAKVDDRNNAVERWRSAEEGDLKMVAAPVETQPQLYCQTGIADGESTDYAKKKLLSNLSARQASAFA